MSTHESPPDAGRIKAGFRQSFHGPNPHSPEPVLLAALSFGPDAVRHGPERSARMAEASRTWFEPPPEAGKCDSERGIAAFLVNWSLAALNRERGFLHAAEVLEAEEGGALVALGFHREQVSRRALAAALACFNRAGDPVAIDSRLRQLQALCRAFHPDYQVTFVMRAAREAGIPWMPVLPARKLWQFGWGRRSEIFFESECGGDSAIGAMISADKAATKAVLRQLGVPVPVHAMVNSPRGIAKAAEAVGWPCVVKPADGGRSVGVTVGIADLAALEGAVKQALAGKRSVAMVESQVPGEVFRIMVLRGKLGCVIRRAVPKVTGDGRSSLARLVAARNAETAAARDKADYLGEIPIDEECLRELARQGLAPESVPKKGQVVTLRQIPLLSTGAVYDDVTAPTHPDTCRMAEMIAAALGLWNCGIDFVTGDIARSIGEEGAVLEVNTTPGLRVPLMAGIAPEAVGRMVLGEYVARIPAVLLVAPRERIAELQGTLGPDEQTGWAVGARSGLGSLALPGGGEGAGVRPESHRAALRVVRNPLAERVFIATAIEDIAAAGLPLDRFDLIACAECRPDAAWEAVFRAHSGDYRETGKLDEALRLCGMKRAK